MPPPWPRRGSWPRSARAPSNRDRSSCRAAAALPPPPAPPPPPPPPRRCMPPPNGAEWWARRRARAPSSRTSTRASARARRARRCHAGSPYALVTKSSAPNAGGGQRQRAAPLPKRWAATAPRQSPAGRTAVRRAGASSRATADRSLRRTKARRCDPRTRARTKTSLPPRPCPRASSTL